MEGGFGGDKKLSVISDSSLNLDNNVYNAELLLPIFDMKERSGLLVTTRLAGVYRFNGLIKWMTVRDTVACMCLNGGELDTDDSVGVRTDSILN